MQIRRNTKAFKTILEIVTTCQGRPDRQELIRLYITKAGQSVENRISIEGEEAQAGFFYDLNYQSVLNHLKSSTHGLVQSDDTPGLYYFHGTVAKDWDETPFEFDTRIKEIFSGLPELPLTREKGKAKALNLEDHTSSRSASAPPKGKSETAEKSVPKKPVMVVTKGPKQPDYKLKREVLFTDLDRVVFREAQLNKKDVLDHYNRIAEYLLPYLKDRPHMVRQQSESGPNNLYKNVEELPKRFMEEIPSWVQQSNGMFLCNDREHLLMYVELGCVEFVPCNSKKNSFGSPDYLVVGIESGSDFALVVDVATAAHEILDGLEYPSFVKSDASTGLHIYVPLDSRTEYDVCERVAEYVCRLIKLKRPDVVSLKDVDDFVYGKVTVDFTLNREGSGVIAPYSLAAGGSATVAAPLLWEEVNEELRLDEFNSKTIFERIEKVGDPFEGMFKRRISAGEELERLEKNYSFLF